ncbi:O-antigen ligase [Pseudobutyrivibrio sp. UC1225]|uniref:O-antigen ligase family protein n=1 Tax=Pseudobutyrivibrio sp. UC1225 TaxID=1798185 RepID=UPI0008F1A988|nr:O-antigen ligase family protein [Pseudobutyrivibrio sp. UC1225]SFN77690.1 O-antigen ligase [Pseudobutyrivibrio sp. UC1225]
MDFIRKNKKLISIILLALIIYVRCDHGVVFTYAKVINLAADFLGFAYCLILTKEDFKRTKESIFNVAVLWLVIFQALVFVYGHFNLFDGNNIYSMQYTILTILPAVLCYEILWHNRDELIEILSSVGAIVIVATYITTIKYDYLWGLALQGQFYRLGKVPGGTDIDTGNLYLLMLIPIMYSVIVLKKLKPYLFFAILGAVGIVLTGSKSSALPFIFVVGIMLLGTAKNSKDVKKYIGIMVGFVAIMAIAILTVPMLYRIIGYRIVEMFTAFGSTEFDLHTSTGQRLAVMDAFKKHFWETPLFGHGFYSFVTMPYSKLEEYREGTEYFYRNIQTHMNYMELLFSFGFLGFVAYYWFPVKLVIDTIKTHSKEEKLICLSLLVSFFFIDLGLDMYYKYMTPYYTYLLIYTFLRRGSKEN